MIHISSISITHSSQMSKTLKKLQKKWKFDHMWTLVNSWLFSQLWSKSTQSPKIPKNPKIPILILISKSLLVYLWFAFCTCNFKIPLSLMSWPKSCLTMSFFTHIWPIKGSKVMHSVRITYESEHGMSCYKIYKPCMR